MIGFRKHRKSLLPDYWNSYSEACRKKQPSDLSAVDFVVLDTETTGMDPLVDRILSMGALRLQHHTIQVKDTLEMFVQQEHYDHMTTRVHCILKNEGSGSISEPEALKRLLRYLSGSVLIGHHIKFDVAMVNSALKRLGLPGLLNKTIDTSFLYKKTLIRSPLLKIKNTYSLDDLAIKYGLSRKDRHTALGDAYLTAISFLKILEELQKKRTVTLKSLLRR